MISSKEIILSKLASSRISEVTLPDLSIIDTFPIDHESPIEKFSNRLLSVGGKAVLTNSNIDLEKQILDQGVKPNLENTICLVADLFKETKKDYKNLDIPSLSKIDYAIVQAEFGISENGAVWIEESDQAHRSLLFIVQHLIVVLDKEKVLNNMHDAYKHLDQNKAFSEPTFGTFISGPSKTADIEQSLVIGAHGSRSHVVYLV